MVSDTTRSANDGPFDRGNAHSQRFDWSNDSSAAMAVVETVATMTEQDPTEMTPLNDIINTDALNDLFRGSATSGQATGYVQFEYERCHVRVRADGTVIAVRSS
jgi:hypothetical protein